MRRLGWALLLTGLLVPATLTAQTGTLTGRVVTAERADAVAGAVVSLRGTTWHALTGDDGAFRLAGVSAGEYDLVVTRLGVVPTQVRVSVEAGGQAAVEVAVAADPVALGELSVTAARLEARRTSPIQKVVVDEAEVARFNDGTLGELLRRQSGAVMGGPPGEAKDIRMRGLDKEYTQVTVDGRRVPGGGEKREVHVDMLPPSLIERVEVVRNPTALTSAQGIGGTVNVVLKQAPAARLMEWQAGGGSADLGTTAMTRNMRLAVGGTDHGIGWLLSGGVQERNSPKTKLVQQFGENGVQGDRNVEAEQKEFREYHFAPRLSWLASSRDAFTFTPLFIASREGKDNTRERYAQGTTLALRERDEDVNARELWRVQGGWSRDLGAGVMLRTTAGMQRAGEEKGKTKGSFRNGTDLTKTDVEKEQKEDLERYLDTRLELPLGRHTLQFGAVGTWKDRSKDKRKTEINAAGVERDRTGPKDVYTLEETEAVLFAQDEFRLASRTVITPGIRLEHTRGSAADLRGERQDATGTVLAPSLHVLQVLGGATNLRGAAAYTVRRPKFDDMVPYLESREGTLLRPDRTGNPELAPEAALSFEAGIEHFFGRSGVVGVTLFDKRIRDRIENTLVQDAETGRYTEMPVNAGTGRMRGIETDVRASLSFVGLRATTVYGNVALYHSKLTLASGDDRPFDKQPPYILNLGFDQRIAPLGVELGANWNRVPETRKHELKEGLMVYHAERTSDFLDVYVARELVGGLRLHVSGRNLLEAGKSKSRTSYRLDDVMASSSIEQETSRRLLFISLSQTLGGR